MRTRAAHLIPGIACSCALALPAWAQQGASRAATRAIADAPALEGSREVVTLAGRASVASGALESRVFDIAMQDATGGIRVFSRGRLGPVQAGDSLVATGTVKRYRGDLELVATRLVVVPGPRRTVAARPLPIDETLIGRYPGQLVRITGRVARSGFSEGGQWLRLLGTAGGHRDSLTVWVPANHAAPITFTRLQPGDSLAATGIVTAYRDAADDPVVWQVVPRDTTDIVLAHASRPIPALFWWATLLSAAGVGLAVVVGRMVARRQLGALRETEARYRQLLALSPDAVLVHVRGAIRFANPAAAQLLGVQSDAALIGQRLEDYVHADSRAALDAAGVQPATGAGDATRMRARLLVRGGGAADVEVTASPCVYHDETAVVLLARDITAQLRYERDLHALALVDELTGLQNRRGFTLFAEQELARARRHGRTPVLVFADLDQLKQVNDTHGHAAGDDALRQMARALRSILRETDIVARWSGDEFVALMGEGGELAAASIGERLDHALAAHAPAGQGFRVSATVGQSPLDPGLPLAEAMVRADSELYALKKRGRLSKELHTPLHVDAVP